MPKTKLNLWFLCLTGSILFFSCGPYSFNPGGSGSKTIAVLLFENETTQFGVREALTDSVSSRFVRDNTLKIAPQGTADLVLSGRVMRYERAAYTFDDKQSVKQYIVRIWVKASVINQKEKKTVWEEEQMEGFGIYEAVDVNGDGKIEIEEDGKQRAVAKLAEDIVNRTVKNW